MKTIAVIAIFTLFAASKSAAVPNEFSYAGRLIEASGKPLTGPVDLTLSFFRSQNGNDEITEVDIPTFYGVDLADGMFQLKLNLSSADFHTIFNGTNDVWIEVRDLSHGRSYPRQKFTTVPYALKVPVDGKGIIYNQDGKLTIGSPETIRLKDSTGTGSITLKTPSNLGADYTFTLPGTYGTTGQFLKSDGAGGLVWESISGGGDMLQANNLSDVADISAARSNLGLGNAATANFGTGNGDVARGDHSHTSANISDFNAAVGAATAVAANTAAIANHATAIGGLGNLATLNEVGSAQITNATIADVDIASNAAIAGGKINPNFGNQNVVTTGSVTANETKLKAASNSGVITLKAPDNQSVDRTFTLPGTFGNNGEILKSDGAGGLTWGAAGGTGDMLKANNLSDLTDKSAARSNLQLGDSATLDVGTTAGSVAAGDHGHTAANISDFNTAVAAAPAVTANTAKNSYPTADATKVGHLTVTAATDLDALRTKSNLLTVTQAADIDDMKADIATNTSTLAGHTTTLSGLGDLATLDTVGSEQITNATIADVDIASNAAIAGGKINPNFGSQNVVTTGSVTAQDLKSNGYVQFSVTSSTPTSSDCNDSSEYGRTKYDANQSSFYVCSQAGWTLIRSTPVIKGYVYGMTLKYASASSITVSAGQAASDDGTYLIGFTSTATFSFANGSGAVNGSQGAEASDSMYDLYAIADSSGSNNPGLFAVVTGQAVSLPTGYNKKRLIGAFRNDSSGNIFRFYQKGTGSTREFFYHGNAFVVDVTSTSTVSTSLADYVPATSATAYIRARVGSSGDTCAMNVAPTTDIYQVAVALNGAYDSAFVWLPLSSSRTFYRQINSTTACSLADIRLFGFAMDI